MLKTKTKKSIWNCSQCGHSEPKWMGQCRSCSEWNTFQEEFFIPEVGDRFGDREGKENFPLRVSEVQLTSTPRIHTTLVEFDRLLGGGIVGGALTLVGGDPGIGKSTLLLQVCEKVAKQGPTVLYVCGEESIAQTGLRAKRLGIHSPNLYLLSETNFSEIKRHIDRIKCDILVIDSIQIVYKNEIPSAPGSVTQVRECATELMHLAKGKGIATFLIGHVTKSGEIAGPRVLEHIVDTVLYFEGDKHNNYRLMRVVKNRFGPTDEIALFQMQASGLVEVANPSKIFLEERRKEATGSVIIPTLEGSRPILVEVQALVADTAFSTPARRSAGVDQNRLALLLAVLEKRVGYQLFNRDVFVSVAGGMRIFEPAIDLGIAVAVSSSLIHKPVDAETVVIGEIGLGGELRMVPRVENRLKEAAQMGFSRCILPKRGVVDLPVGTHMDLIGVEMVEEAIDALFT